MTTLQRDKAPTVLWYGLAVMSVAALAGLIALTVLLVKGSEIDRIPAAPPTPPAAEQQLAPPPEQGQLLGPGPAPGAPAPAPGAPAPAPAPPR